MTLVWIPAGRFVMGSLDGASDERPRCVARVHVTNGHDLRVGLREERIDQIEAPRAESDDSNRNSITGGGT